MPNSLSFRRLAGLNALVPELRSVQVYLDHGDHVIVGVVAGLGGPEQAVVLSYRPASEHWEVVHRTRIAAPGGARRLADARIEFGFWGTAHRHGAAYLSLVLPAGSCLLRSRDGADFEPLYYRAEGLQRPLGPLAAVGADLFAAPVGTLGDGDATARDAIVYRCDDPAAGHWAAAAEPGFGDDGNRVVQALLGSTDHLFAAVGNRLSGFELWSLLPGVAPGTPWNPLLREGALRFTENSAVSAAAYHDGTLYLGVGCAGPAGDRGEVAALAAPELLQVTAAGDWSVRVGMPRFSPDGLKLPLDAYGPGFSDPATTAIAGIAAFRGGLYAVTNGASSARLWSHQPAGAWHATELDFVGAGASVRSLGASRHGLLLAVDGAEPGLHLGT